LEKNVFLEVFRVTTITIKDVAKHAEVSIATVSRVINKNYYVSPETSEKVLQAINKLNYYPNSVARSLKSNSTLTIGFLVSDISNGYFISVIRAVEDIVSKENYNIIVCSTSDKKEEELVYLKLLMSKQVDGMVINTSSKNDDFIASLSKQMPIVLLNRKISQSDFKGDLIDSDNIQGAYALTAHLLSLGHRKIGVINGNLGVSTGSERFIGFKKAMLEAGIGVGENYPYRYDGDFTMESGTAGAAKLMTAQDRPTAILAMNNAMTIGAIKYFRGNGIDVPGDASIACYGNIDNVELMYVQPSIVTLNPVTIGHKIGEFILERISDDKLNNREFFYNPQLVPGNGVKQL
jgi:LacI family transcriptional regulator